MNTADFRSILNARIEQLRADGKLDKAADLELAREYFANPDFRAKLGDFLFDMNRSNARP